jgi:hypothetical protein
MRHDIVSMLLTEVFVDEDRSRETYNTLRSFYPRYPPVSSVRLESDAMSAKFLDFRNVMNPAPVSVQQTMSFAALYSVFRNNGLRHMVVVSPFGLILGANPTTVTCNAKFTTLRVA